LNDKDERDVTSSSGLFWEVALTSSTKAADFISKPELHSLNSSDKEKLTTDATWVPTQARDFLAEPSLHTTVALLDTFEGPNTAICSGKVYQLNYVELEPPSMGQAVCTDAGDRIWLSKVNCRDTTAAKEIGMRQKAALQLAGLSPEEPESVILFKARAAAGEIQYPLLSSIRISVEERQNTVPQSTAGASSASIGVPSGGNSANTKMVIVEAKEQVLTVAPNASFTELLNFVAHCAPRDDGLIPATLSTIKASDHYPLQVVTGDSVRPCAKALALILATERTGQDNIDAEAVRLTTSNVLDALGTVQEGAPGAEKYQLSSMCHPKQLSNVILTPPRSGKRQQAALALITGVTGPNTFAVEGVQPVAPDELDRVMKTMKKLISLAQRIKYDGELKRPIWKAEEGNPISSVKKCKQLGANPSDASLPDL
jgi:hypothetical protein